MPDQKNIFCNCLYYSANALARTITRMAEESFAPSGLAPSYVFIIMAVNNQPGISIGELAEVMQLSYSTITRLVEKLEHKQLVVRSTEGRNTFVTPTPQAIELNPKILECWNGLYNKFLTMLGKKEADKLAATISKANSKLCA